jgi:hypothetical protein
MAYSSSGREKTPFLLHRPLVVLVQQFSDLMLFRATSSTLSLEPIVVTSSVDPSMVRVDRNRLVVRDRPLPRKVAQTGASRDSHSAPAQRLLRPLASLAWMMTRSMVPDRQDQSPGHVDCSAGVDLPRDQEVNQRPLPGARLRDRGLYRAHSRENKVLQSKSIALVIWLPADAIWMSRSGILQCA